MTYLWYPIQTITNIMTFTMYDTLLQLPIFQGISRSDLTIILDKVKLEFLKYEAGEKIVSQGERCDALYFLLNGEMIAQTLSSASAFTFSEYLPAPFVIEPSSLFGLHNNFACSYVASSEVNLLKINKLYIYSELSKYDIFRINYLNIISTRVQINDAKMWEWRARNIEERIAHVFSIFSERPTGKKILRIKMEDLADILNETRIKVSRALNDMQDRGLLELHRKEIVVKALENMPIAQASK